MEWVEELERMKVAGQYRGRCPTIKIERNGANTVLGQNGDQKVCEKELYLRYKRLPRGWRNG